jgi:hypothetical protein
MNPQARQESTEIPTCRYLTLVITMIPLPTLWNGTLPHAFSYKTYSESQESFKVGRTDPASRNPSCGEKACWYRQDQVKAAGDSGSWDAIPRRGGYSARGRST